MTWLCRSITHAHVRREGPLSAAYEAYSFNIIPAMGKMLAGDAQVRTRARIYIPCTVDLYIRVHRLHAYFQAATCALDMSAWCYASSVYIHVHHFVHVFNAYTQAATHMYTYIHIHTVTPGCIYTYTCIQRYMTLICSRINSAVNSIKSSAYTHMIWPPIHTYTHRYIHTYMQRHKLSLWFRS